MKFDKTILKGISVDDDLEELDEIIGEYYDGHKMVRGSNKSEETYTEKDKRKRPPKNRQPYEEGFR